MRFNFLELKRKKDSVIFLLLLLLWISYSLSIFVLAWLLRAIFVAEKTSSSASSLAGQSDPLIVAWHWTLVHWKTWLIIGFALAFFLWFYSLFFSKEKVLTLFRAYSPDENDRYHKRFVNIVDEVKIASGIHNISACIVPDADINAFSCQGVDGSIVIGATEGAVAQLTRQELEAVVAHEMGHVMAGDLLSTTMFTSIMSFYSAMKEVGWRLARADSRNRREGGIVAAVGVVLYLVGGVWSFINGLLVLAISRHREYRADMLAVKIVRDPESLARALIKIDRNVKSEKIIKDRLMGSLFISNPFEEEDDDVWSGLWTTHPPIKKRIEILCNVAGVDRNTLEEKIVSEEKEELRPIKGLNWLDGDEGEESVERWWLFKEGEWTGPFLMEELLTMGIDPTDLIRRDGDESPMMVQDNILLMIGLRDGVEEMRAHLNKAKMPEDSKSPPGPMTCPRCNVPLRLADYEGTEVYACPSCYGILADPSAIRRIILRKEVGFDAEIKEWGDKLLAMTEDFDKRMRGGMKPVQSFICPHCGEVRPCDGCKVVSYMYKRYVSNRFPIEVDVCQRCHRVWFDPKELEVLQYMVEKLIKEKGLTVRKIIDYYVGIV